MVIDASALVAILSDEAEREDFVEKIYADPVRLISAATLVETSIMIESRRGDAGGHDLDLFLLRASIDIEAVDADQAALAREAYRRYGKGRHPARLNLGDCFAYALAKSSGESLLFKGTDFGLTDVTAA